MDPKIFVAFDGHPGLSFVQGEDRTFLLVFANADDGTAINLTGATLGIGLPQQGGGDIKRSSGPMTLSSGMVTLGTQSGFTLNNHGLATGDPVQFTGSSLPAPLAIATTYLVVVGDLNNFSLTNTSGTPIVLTTAGAGSYTMALTPSDLTITNAEAGAASLVLRSPVSSLVNEGITQDFQVSMTLGGKIRVVVIKVTLDVLVQPDP